MIAILDTGVDPGAAGLQVCSDGKPKMLDLIDCTGSGDVDCSTSVTCDPGTQLKGLSGRLLRLGKWHNPSNTFKLGLKHSTDLFPKGLLDRLCKEHTEAFDQKHHALTTAVQLETAAHDAKHLSGDADVLIKNDLKCRLEALKDLRKAYEDPGVLMDCVVFHDGHHWRAVIDTNGSGDLTSKIPMASFNVERQFDSFDSHSLLNFSVNLYDEGNTLSIVTLAGTHGTHVAAIAAAHHPDDPSVNGVAPGAQIVSLKIGDTRLGSMETGAGLVRAAIELCRLNVDVANMSYGEATAIPNAGRFIELLREYAINRKGCVFVSSGGNNGPALTTVGAPGGTGSDIIGVGAYVTSSMIDAEYGLLDTVKERPYTWSSRGPSADGDIGVDIFAPGAAITSVPQYTTHKSQLMNGTSMSSPNLAGCVALLISGLKAKGIPYNPYLIKKAIQATGKSIDDPFGIPFIQVAKAFDFLVGPTLDYIPCAVRYDVSINPSNARGVYLRDLAETNSVQQFAVTVNPVFMDDKTPQKYPLKLQYEVQLAFECSERWISAPEFLLFDSSGRSFNIRVDPSRLPSGLHIGKIHAYDTKKRDVGPLFSIPVTVCKPDVVSQSTEAALYVKYDDLHFTPGDIHRKFVHVPIGANFAELIVRSKERETPARLTVHLVQLHPQTRYTKFEKYYSFMINATGSGSKEDQSVYRKTFPVLSNATMEVCVAQFWSSLDPSTVSIELIFHGALATFSSSTNGNYGITGGTGADVSLISSGDAGFTRVDLVTPVRNEDLSPSVSLDTLRKVLRPTESTVSPLKSRDVLPDSKQLHQLVLTYSFKVSEPGSVTVRFPRMNDMLYDSSIENFCFYVFDGNKKVICFHDVYAKSSTLPEGSYTVRSQVVSGSFELLEKLGSMAMMVDYGLSKAVSLPLYSSLSDAISGNSSAVVKRKASARGQKSVLFIGELGSSGMPKDAKAGDYLVGKFEVVKLDGQLYSVALVVPP